MEPSSEPGVFDLQTPVLDDCEPGVECHTGGVVVAESELEPHDLGSHGDRLFDHAGQVFGLAVRFEDPALGVATEAEADVETLDDRLAAAEETMIKWYGMDDQLARDLFYVELLKMDSKPYPPYEGAEMILRLYGGWDARAKFRPDDFYDDTIIKELDESGYIDSLYPGGKSPR